MSGDTSSPSPEVPSSKPDQLDLICGRSEAEWRADRQPLLAKASGNVGDPIHSQDSITHAPDDPDATLTYTVSRKGGKLEQLIDPEQQKQLCDAFAPGGIIQSRYRIDRELGRGGMGVVFLGRDLRLDRPVAVKVSLLLGRVGNIDAVDLDALRGAFAEEARLGANLNHPVIATVYDYGFHDDKPFTVFEYLPGDTLRDVLRRRGRLPLEEVRLIIGALAQALDFAHAHRVVHRDLKPENVRATEQGLFKVLDLGLAREFGRDVDWSGFGGTPAYAAPEQAAGRPCDGRADQYALALIAYELLAGHRLFQASGRNELLAMHRDAEPTGLATDLADAPVAIRLALARALSKDPNARFATCGDFALSLGCQLLNAPVSEAKVLMEADVERLTVGRLVRSNSFPWLTDAVHLTLTRDALWSAYQTEVRRWPLSDVEQIEPRSDPIDERAAAELAGDGIVRRLHRDAEAGIRLVRGLHVALLVPVLLALVLRIGLVTLGGPGERTWPNLVTIGMLAFFSVWLFAVNRGLRRFRAWSRWAAFTEALLAPVVAVWFLVTRAAIPRPPTLPDPLAEPVVAGLLLSGVIVLAACLAWILFRRQASVLFTPSHRDAADRTPYLEPRRPFGLDRASKRTLRLKLRALDERLSQVAFRFSTVKECRQWAGRLAAQIGRAADPAEPERESATAEPTLVVLLRQRPTARYQLLGAVEAKADKRRKAEAGLLVRAAIIGGDAVVDLQEEFLPDFGRTVRRLTGTAVRAVDAESRFEFRSRWYADEVARVSGWALVLTLISLMLTVLSGIIVNAVEQGGIAIVTADAAMDVPTRQAFASTLLRLVLQTVLMIAAIHAWPIVLAALTRCLRWPQFVRPLALTLAAFSLRSLYLLAGLVAGALFSGGWSGLIYYALWLLDPLNLALLVFGLFLGRAAWRADRVFRRLVPDAARKASTRRSLVGGATLVASVTYAVLLACYIIWAAHRDGCQFRLPPVFDPKAATPMAHFRTAAALQ